MLIGKEAERIRNRKQIDLSMQQNAENAERFATAMHQVYETQKEINKLTKIGRKRTAD